jgi:hypothetical protein
MTYTNTQFKLGEAKAKYNSFDDKWFPAIGRAVNFTKKYETCEEATSQAKADYDNKVTAYYE